MKMNDNLMILIQNGNSIEACRRIAKIADQTLTSAYLFITGRMTCADFYKW